MKKINVRVLNTYTSISSVDGVYDLYEKMYPPRKASFDKLCEIEEHPVRGLKPRVSIDESLIHYVIHRENMQFE